VTVVNGRFLRAAPTGLHRTARSLLDAARKTGANLEVFAPPGVNDPRVDRTLPAPAGRFGDHVWEQVVLPAAARGRPVLSLANTGPLATRRAAVMVHDLAPLVGPGWFAPAMRAYGALVAAAARRARLVITPSHAVRDEIVAHGATGRVVTVRPAVDAYLRAASAPEVEAVRTRWGLAGPFALFVGWADPRKDLATALSAHLRAVRRVPHQLVLVGLPHPTFAPVHVPPVPSVVNAGYVSDDDLRALLTAAAVLMYPSRYEGFGLPPLEAWACGTPALVSDIPVLRESTCGRACYLPVGRADAWAAALQQALVDGLAVPSLPAWSWDDAAGVLVGALEDVDLLAS